MLLTGNTARSQSLSGRKGFEKGFFEMELRMIRKKDFQQMRKKVHG